MDKEAFEWLRIITEIVTVGIIPLLIWLGNILRKIDRRVNMHHDVLFGPMDRNGLREDVRSLLLRVSDLETQKS